jgi:hypothetical protein
MAIKQSGAQRRPLPITIHFVAGGRALAMRAINAAPRPGSSVYVNSPKRGKSNQNRGVSNKSSAGVVAELGPLPLFWWLKTKVILSLVGLALFVAEIDGKNVQEPELVTAT